MQKEFPVRKKNRLQGYDYSLNGMYYLTLCVKGKHNLLGEVVVGAITYRPQDVDDANGRLITNGRLIIAPTTVSNVIKGMKSYVTKQIGFSMWQKSFHDHIICDEEDYWYRWQYIDQNPAKWAEDEFFYAR